MAHYRRLSLMEREELSRMLAAGASLRAAAQALQRAPSTLSRELTRHHTSPITYRAVPAHQRAQRRAHQRRKPRTLMVHPRLRAAVLHLLAHRWSPEQIAHGLPQRYPDDPTMRISHEAIYTYLYVLPSGALKRELARYLPSAPPLSASPQGPALVAPRPGHCDHRRTAGRGRRSHGARPLGGRLAGRPCQRVGAGDAGGTDHPLYAAGAAAGKGCVCRATGLCPGSPDPARPTSSLPHV